MRVLFVLLMALVFVPVMAFAHGPQNLPENPPGFVLHEVQSGNTWKSLADGDERKLHLMQKINRMNVRLRAGWKILVPVTAAAYEFSPMPKQIGSNYERHLVINLDTQYFGAYEGNQLVRWGPVSTGRHGRTPTSKPGKPFTAKWKDKWHRSSIYNNARMYFAVQFLGDYFTHEQVLPGHPASAGCARMLWKDAEWKFDWIQSGDRVSVVNHISEVM